MNAAQMGQKTVRPLPVSYTTMEDVSFHKDEIAHVPSLHDINSHPVPASRSLQQVLQDGYQWLNYVDDHLERQLTRDDWISWAAYHAVHSGPPSFISKTYLLPLLTESANSPITTLHCMKTIKRATEYLNPGQTPVMVADQPLYTLAKRLQWKFSDTDIAEDKYLVMLGAMHTEKMLWTVSGDWLEYSGWTTAITNSGVATSGTAQSFIGASHICRYVHQVSVTALYTLMKKAYDQYVELRQTTAAGLAPDLLVAAPPQPLKEWVKQKCLSHPQADFWFKSMELDLLILQVG